MKRLRIATSTEVAISTVEGERRGCGMYRKEITCATVTRRRTTAISISIMNREGRTPSLR
jgi:hypothetical protein